MKKILLLAVLAGSFGCAKNPTEREVGDYKYAYDQGVKDALDAIVLLNLVQQLQGTNRCMGDMAAIVRTDLKVKPTCSTCEMLDKASESGGPVPAIYHKHQ